MHLVAQKEINFEIQILLRFFSMNEIVDMANKILFVFSLTTLFMVNKILFIFMANSKMQKYTYRVVL